MKFEIDSTPFPDRRIQTSKYRSMFAQMRPGQCIKTEPENMECVAQAMRSYIKRMKRTDVVVKQIAKMDDGYARVYMMPVKPLKMADVEGRKVTKLGSW